MSRAALSPRDSGLPSPPGRAPHLPPGHRCLTSLTACALAEALSRGPQQSALDDFWGLFYRLLFYQTNSTGWCPENTPALTALR